MNPQVTRLKRRERVRIRLVGDTEWVRGVVWVASHGNPSSVGVLIEGGLRSPTGVWVGGGLPLTVDYEAQTVKSLLGDDYEIEVAPDDV